MTSATSLDGTELVPIVQSGVSKKVTKQILTNAVDISSDVTFAETYRESAMFQTWERCNNQLSRWSNYAYNKSTCSNYATRVLSINNSIYSFLEK